jgi:hypothetical protein
VFFWLWIRISRNLLKQKYNFNILGNYHEQSRWDRDSYVRINTQNIQSGQAHNFDKYTTTQAGYHGTSYDYYSIMHYESTAFSSNGQPTVVPLQAGVTLVNASQKSGYTTSDIAAIRSAYGC